MMPERREYKAFIEAEPGKPMFRATVWAESYDDARALLEAEHGAGTVFFLRNEEDSQRKR